MRNFDTIPLAVRTVDGEILSEIAIHNFEKNRKIETRILPYGRQFNNITKLRFTQRYQFSTETESVI